MKITKEKRNLLFSLNLLSEIKKKSKFIDLAEDGFDYLPSFCLGSFPVGFHPSLQTKSLREGGTCTAGATASCRPPPQASPVQPKQQVVLNHPLPKPSP